MGESAVRTFRAQSYNRAPSPLIVLPIVGTPFDFTMEADFVVDRGKNAVTSVVDWEQGIPEIDGFGIDDILLLFYADEARTDEISVDDSRFSIGDEDLDEIVTLEDFVDNDDGTGSVTVRVDPSDITVSELMVERGLYIVLRVVQPSRDMPARRRRFESHVSLNKTTVETFSLSAPDDPLQAQGERTLSPLERDVIRFVFGEDGPVDPDTDDLCIEVASMRPFADADDGDFIGSYSSYLNRITMDTLFFEGTENMGASTTLDDIDLADRQNLNYLSVFVHEATHYWQDEINYSPKIAGRYDFSEEDLDSLEFDYELNDAKPAEYGYNFGDIGSEQFPAMVEAWFVIMWQLEYLPEPEDGGERMIDLSGPGVFDGLFFLDRYERIRDLPYEKVELPFDDGNVMIKVPKRFVSEDVAADIADDFDDVINLVRNQDLVTRDNPKYTLSGSPSQQGDNN